MNERTEPGHIKQSIIDLAAALVRIPSRSGADASEDIIEFLSEWHSQRGLASVPLRTTDGKIVGLYIHLKSKASGPAICLDACLDTAPFGNEEVWRFPPTSGTIWEGRLFGRGAADSKAGVAIFSHIALAVRESSDLPRGELFFLFDADEHSGEFRGAKRFLDEAPVAPDAVLIGYPGNERLSIGSRGFLRLEIIVFGLAAHSGSSLGKGFNAITKMARLIDAMKAEPLPEEPDPDFSAGPWLNITEVKGGEGFSVVPDRCTCKVDFRLTPQVNEQSARKWCESIIQKIDFFYPGPAPTQINWLETWPAYRLPPESPLVREFLGSAEEVFRRKIPVGISGPSNIGNYLASQGIPALSGFGVAYANIHATDESVELDSVMGVYETYTRAIPRLLKTLHKKP